jgi:hypothetical protein
VIVALFIRRLRPDKTYEDFKAAWEAEHDFSADPREIEVGGAESLLRPARQGLA